MKRIDSSYKLIEFLFGRGNSADAVVNVATAQFRFGAIVLINKLINTIFIIFTVANSNHDQPR